MFCQEISQSVLAFSASISLLMIAIAVCVGIDRSTR